MLWGHVGVGGKCPPWAKGLPTMGVSPVGGQGQGGARVGVWTWVRSWAKGVKGSV